MWNSCFNCTWCKNEYKLGSWDRASCKHPNHEFVISDNSSIVESSKCNDYNKIRTKEDELKEKCGFRTIK